VTKLLLLLAVALLVLVSCSDATGPTAPTPGTLLLTLSSPHDDDGALLLHVAGPAITPAAVAAATGTLQVFARSGTDGGVAVAVFGSPGAGPLLRLQVTDVTRYDAYHVTVVEAADANNVLRAVVTGYSARFVKER
jgi:hypothetical protein